MKSRIFQNRQLKKDEHLIREIRGAVTRSGGCYVFRVMTGKIILRSKDNKTLERYMDRGGVELIGYYEKPINKDRILDDLRL